MSKKVQKVSAVQPTSYSEVGRLHASALGTLKGSVVITSTQNAEGSSLLSHLMAQRSAESGTKTLLIDLNMRNMAITESLGLPRRAWRLHERMVNEPLDDLIVESNDVPNLYFLPAPVDEESIRYLKDVNHASQFLAGLERKFSHVVVDTTPVGNVNQYNADPVILAASAKRTVLTVMAAKTPKAKVKAAVKQLREAGAFIEGIVMNDKHNPSLKDEMVKLVNIFSKVSPGLSSWLRYKVMNSDAFN
jgi:Mrp family chromosome partitioning ATPase